MRFRSAAALAVGACLIAAGHAVGAGASEVVISINKSTQSMSVLVDGVERHRWTVSTGLGGGPHDGNYRAGRMERSWYSRKYNMAPMPHSIFFDGNYAIHGTYHIKLLGRRASKGCVRLHPTNAAKLFELVRANHTTTAVVVSNTTHVAARPLPAEIAPPAAEPAMAKPDIGAAGKRAETSVPEAVAQPDETARAPVATADPSPTAGVAQAIDAAAPEPPRPEESAGE